MVASSVPSGCASPVKGDGAVIGVLSTTIVPPGFPFVSTLTLTVRSNDGPAQAPWTDWAERTVSAVIDNRPQATRHGTIFFTQSFIKPPIGCLNR